MTLTLIGLVPLVPPLSAGEERGPLAAVHQFLASEFQFGTGEFRDLARRRAVARTLRAADGREVATVGAISVAAPVAFYAEQLQDIAAFKRDSPAVLQIGAFSVPARLDDAGALSLDAREVEALRACRIGSCEIQLSDEAITRIRRVLPRDQNSALVAERAMREVLVDLVNGYRERGESALMIYGDTDEPVSVAEEFRALVAARPAVLERFPVLHRHVVNFPRMSSADVSDVVYWSKESLGPAVILTVTHLAIMRLSDMPFETVAAASKQIYSSRYFDSSLGITFLLDASVGSDPRMVLVYVNRSRIDALGGFWGGLKRAIVRSRTRSGVSGSLVEARDVVERRFQREMSRR